MNEMVERAARAAYVETQGPVSDEDWHRVWAWHTDPHSISQGGPWYLLQCVKATIAALREPTEAMIAAGDSTATWSRFNPPKVNAEGCWRAMIDRALAD